MNLLMVDTRDSEVKCPHCQEKMRKITYGLPFPRPEDIKNAQKMSQYYGQAICDSCENRDIRGWAYTKTG